MTEEKDFIDKNEERLKIMLKEISNSIKGFQESILISITPAIQNAAEEKEDGCFEDNDS